MTELTRTDMVGAANLADERILGYLGLNPRDPKSAAVVAVARRYDLDPVLRHVIVIPKGGVYITRDGLLHIAHQSGQLDGIVVEQEPTLSDDGAEWVARVAVYRKDMGHPFTFPGRYPVNGSNKDYAQEMALKAAESHALRRAFAVAGLPAYDEHRAEQAPIRATATRKPPRTIREAVGASATDAEVEAAFADAGPMTTDEKVLRAEAAKRAEMVQADDWPDPRLGDDPPVQSPLAAAQAAAKEAP